VYQVRELTNARDVDRVVEIGGPGTIAKSLKALAGRTSQPDRSEPLEVRDGLDPLLLTGRGITLVRSASEVGSISRP
jgi:hypothetical protein